MKNIYYYINRQLIEEYCKKYMTTHTDWTGMRVETANRCESKEEFVNLLKNNIEDISLCTCKYNEVLYLIPNF